MLEADVTLFFAMIGIDAIYITIKNTENNFFILSPSSRIKDYCDRF